MVGREWRVRLSIDVNEVERERENERMRRLEAEADCSNGGTRLNVAVSTVCSMYM